MANLGFEGTLSHNTGIYATPVWATILNVRDVSLNGEWGKADSSSRRSRIKKNEQTLLDRSVTFQMIDRDGDTDIAVISAAFAAGTFLDMLILNGPVATPGKFGVRGPFKVFKFANGQPLEGVGTFDVEIAPTDDSTDVIDYVVV